MATNPWDEFPVAEQAPASNTQFPGVIRGAPKPPEAPSIPSGYEPDGRGGLRPIPGGPADKPDEGESSTVDQKKIATLLTRIAGGFSDIQGVTAENKEAQMPGAIEAIRGDLMPGGVGGIVTRGIAGGDRRSVHDSQRDVLDALLTLGTGAAYNAEQLSGQMASYFPQYGDGGPEIALKNQRLRRLIEAAKANAGPAWAEVEPAIAPYMQSLDNTELEQTKAAQGGEGPAAAAGFGEGYFDAEGNPLGPDGGMAYDKDGNLIGLTGRVTDDSPDPTVAAASQKITDQFGAPGAGDLVKQGFTLGLSDEAAGIGGAIAGALQGNFDVSGNYYLNRDVERLRLEEARNRLGGTGTAIEALGGVATGGVGTGGGINALMKAGGMAGGVGGFGYGDGFENSAGNALISAGGGALLGGSLGYIGQRAGQASVARQAERAALGQRAQDISQAGAAEGVNVNRAMVDPRLQNRVTGVDATMAGGPKIQREMGVIEGQIGSRVEDLGRGGTALNPEEAGGTIKEAAERFITKSGQSARIKYDRAEQLAGNVKIEPRQSLQAVDQMIAQLGETPNTNKAEMAFLQEIKSDLSQNLSVGALRRMRTSLRQKISKGELTFGESEARVLAIMDSAADDIRAGLTQAGNAGAARAFDAADTAYRARMDYINGTIQKVIGKRNANKPAEQVFTTFSNMAKGKDAAGLRKFYATLEPDEAADVAATFASELGRNNRGEFSVAHFLSQTDPKKFSDSALVTIFGKDGAESVKNLRTIGSEVSRVTGSMNSRKSGTAVGNDYRSWMFNLLLGAGTGAYSGNVAAGAATAVTLAGAKAGRDILSARALMSPKITKWLKMAPRTTNPKAIDAHFERLGDIARAEPALAPDIEAIKQAFMQAANDNAGLSSSVAQDQNPQER